MAETSSSMAILGIICALFCIGLLVGGLTMNERSQKAECRQTLAYVHSLRDSFVVADIRGDVCTTMLSDSIIARARAANTLPPQGSTP